MDNDYKFYMSRYIKVTDSWEKEISLEDYFLGMKYMECQGLSKFGKVKNIYTETYAETDELRVFIPTKAVRGNTDLEFKFAFIGENRRDIYDRFVEWLTGYKITYWDTCRNRKVLMYLSDAVEPGDDELYGSQPYVIATFKFKNMRGQTEKKV